MRIEERNLYIVWVNKYTINKKMGRKNARKYVSLKSTKKQTE